MSGNQMLSNLVSPSMTCARGSVKDIILEPMQLGDAHSNPKFWVSKKFPCPTRYFPIFGIELLPKYMPQGDSLHFSTSRQSLLQITRLLK